MTGIDLNMIEVFVTCWFIEEVCLHVSTFYGESGNYFLPFSIYLHAGKCYRCGMIKRGNFRVFFSEKNQVTRKNGFSEFHLSSSSIRNVKSGVNRYSNDE